MSAISRFEQALRATASTCILGSIVACLFSFVFYVTWRIWQRHLGLNTDSDVGILFVGILVLAGAAVVALVASAVLSGPVIFALSMFNLNTWYLNIAVGLCSSYVVYVLLIKGFNADPDMLKFCLANGFVGSLSGWWFGRTRPLSLADIASVAMPDGS